MRRITNSKQWINDDTKSKKVTQKNIEFIRALRQIDAEMAKLKTLEYFLVTKLGITNVRQMMHSMVNQGDLIYVLIENLKEYGMRPDAEKAIWIDIQKMNRRVEHIWKITLDNIRLTKYWVFFNERGFDCLRNFETVMSEGTETPLDYLIDEIEVFNAEHEAEIAEHLESVREEIETREAHQAEVWAKEKAEKQAEKDREKAERAEQKEFAKIAKSNKIREKRLEKSFEKYWR